MGTLLIISLDPGDEPHVKVSVTPALYAMLMVSFQNTAYNVVEAHHQRNRHPSAPDPHKLNAIRQSSMNAPVDVDSIPDNSNSESAESDSPTAKAEPSDEADSDTETGSETETEDIGTHGPKGKHAKRKRAPRNSKGIKDAKFTQLRAYPGQWRTVLEDAKRRNRCLIAIKIGFPSRLVGLKQAEDCLREAMDAHKAENSGVVEIGMCQLIMFNYPLSGYICQDIILSTKNR
jgi:hypothetical protein